VPFFLHAAEFTSTYQRRRFELEVTFTTGVCKIGRVPVAVANAVDNDDDIVIFVVVVVSRPNLTLRDMRPCYANVLYRTVIIVKIIMQPADSVPAVYLRK